MKFTYIIIFLFLFANLHGQDRQITGLVTDKETKKPVINARVAISGTDLKALTSTRGVFQFVVPASAKDEKIIISHIGHNSAVTAIPQQDQFRISLDRKIVRLPDFIFKVMKAQARLVEFSVGNDAMEPGDRYAQYPGGLTALYEGLYNNFRATTLSKENYEGKVEFMVNDKGSVESIRLLPSDSVIEKDIVSSLMTLPPWQAATQNGIPTLETFQIRLSFTGNKKSRSVKDMAVDEDDAATKPLTDYLAKILKYPVAARRMGIAGKVIVSFDLDDESNLIAIRLLDDIGGDCGKEIVNALSTAPKEVLKSLPKTTSSFVLPVIFGLDVAPVNVLVQTKGSVYRLPTITVIVYAK